MKDVTNTVQKGFTLVELLIVVIILALLAAIVVPQFASSTDDAKLSSLKTSLSNVRAAIDLYYQQHGEYPGANTSAPTQSCAGGGAGNALAGDAQAFLDQMSKFTDAEGGTCTIKDTEHKFGPYLKKNTLPNNPITEDNTLEVISLGNLLMTGGAGLGWKYDVEVGKFIANDTNTDVDGNQYDTY